MPLLATVEQVQKRAVFPNTLTDVNQAIEDALLAATQRLEEELRTGFGVVSAAVDDFFVRSPKSDGAMVYADLRLRRGFLTSTPTIYRAKTRVDLASSVESMADVATFDLVKGKVTITDFPFENDYLRVTYNAGFATAGTPSVYQAVPDWLRELAISYAILLLNQSPLFRKENQQLQTLEVLGRDVEVTVGNRVRYLPGALAPLS